MKKSILFGLYALYLIHPAAWAQTTSWRGTTSTSWSAAANWTAGVPTATVDAIIGDANFTGPNQPSITAKSFCKSLTIGTGIKASTLTVNHATTVSGNITIGANGTIDHSTKQAISLRGNWSNSGTYIGNQNRSTITFSGTTQTISGATTFRRLLINAGSTTTLGANISIGNQIKIGGTLDPGDSPTFAVSGNAKMSVALGGTLVVRASTFAANYPINGAKTFAAGSTVDYAATSVNQTVANNLTYSTLRISGGLTKTLAGNLPALNGTTAASGNIIVVAGTLDLSSFSADRATGGGATPGGTVSVANGATLKIGGTRTFPANYQTHSLGVSSTVEYSGTNQSVTKESYGNLTLSSSSGSATKTMPTSAMTIAGNLTSTLGAGTSVSFTAGQVITVKGNVSIGPSTTFNGSSFAHSIGGNWTNNGIYTGSTGLVTFTGTAALLDGTGFNNFNNLTFTGTGISAATNTALAVAGNLATTGAGTFTHLPGGPGSVTMSGASKSISGAGILLNHLVISGSTTTAASLTVGGNLTVNGTFSATAGTITMTGAANTIGGAGPLTFNGLNIRGGITTARNFSIQSDLSVSGAGTFTATAGTASFIGTSIFSGTANLFNVTLNGTKLQLGANSVLGIAGALAVSAGLFDAASTTPNTVNFNALVAQTVLPVTYDNLSFSGGGTKTASGGVTILGDLLIGSGASFSAVTFTHSLHGNWINQGSFVAGSSTVQLLGGLDTAITGVSTFNTLTLNKTSPNTVVALNDSVSVTTLNMTSGKMQTGPNSVTITSTRNGPGIILGTITRTHSFGSGIAYAFESPNNTVNFSALSGVSSVTVTVGVSPIADFPFGSAVNREYDISIAASGAYDATLRLHYEDNELNGNAESALSLLRFLPPWTLSGASARDTTGNWVEQSALTDITGRWTVSDNPRIVAWTGLISTAWETAGNWVVLAGSAGTPPNTNDVVVLGNTNFVNQPTINSAILVRSLSFASVQATTLTLGAGGSLVTAGNVAGEWSADAAHTIEVGARSLNVGGDLSLSDGTNAHAINLNIGSGSTALSGDLLQSGGANVTVSGSGNLQIGGDFIHGNGGFTAGTGTVTYNGSDAQRVAGGITYHNLSFDKTAGTATLTNLAVVGGNLLLTNGGTFLVEASLVISNHVTLHTNTTLNADSSTLSVGGNWANLGHFTPGTGTVTFNGTNAQSIAATTFNNLTIAKVANAATLAGNLIINGTLNVSAGVLDLSTFTADRSDLGGALTLAGNTTLRIGTGSSFPSKFDVNTLAASSTVQYYGSGTQTVSDKLYGNLYLSNGGAVPKTLAGNTTVAGDLLLNSGATLDASAFGLEVKGNWTNGGAFTASSSSVTLSGLSKNLSGNTTFNNLTVSGGYTGLSDITVQGTMVLSGTYAAGITSDTFAGDFSNSGTLTSGGTITFMGSIAQTLALNAGFNCTGTVNFNGTVAPSFVSAASPSLQNVNVNNSGGIVPDIAWTVQGAFTVGSGALFDGGSATHTFDGNFTNLGSVTSAGTLVFNPASAVTLDLGGVSFSCDAVVFGGTGQISFGPDAQPFGSVAIANTHAAGVTAAADWTLSGDLFIGPGATFNGGSSLVHTVAGDWSNNGNFNGTTSTVVMTGTADPINGGAIAGIGVTTFNHLSVSGIVAADTDFNVAGNFINDGAFDGTGAIVSFTGNTPSIIGGITTPTIFDFLTIAKSAATTTLAVNLSELTTLTVSSGTFDISTFQITQNSLGGALVANSGGILRVGGANTLPVFNSYTLDPASTVEYYGNASQIITPANYGNLVSSATGARILPSGATIGIAGAFIPGANAYTITNSTINYNSPGSQTVVAFNYFNLSSSSAGARILSTNSPIGVAGVFSPGTNPYTTDGSTISFNGGNQTIPVFTYFNLVSSGSGTKNLSGDIIVDGSLTLASATFNDAGFTASVNGDVDNDATHAGTGKILLTGGSAPHALSGSGVYQNLALDDLQGAALSQTNLTVSGTLTFTSGNITTTTNKVIIGQTGSVARTSGHVVGLLQKFVTNLSTVTNTFEIGDAASYAPISVIFTNVTTAGNLVGSTTPGEHPDLSNSGVSSFRDVNRFWSMTNAGIVFTRYSALFNFASGDIDAGASPTNFVVAKRDGTNWTKPTVSSRTATNIQASGMTNFSDFVVGETGLPPATITNQPQSLTVNLGTSAQFSVGATASGTLTYQWLFNGNPIAGQTNSTLAIASAQTGDAGTYSVVVYNDGESPVTSSGAVLTVNQPPTLAAISDQSVNELATLTVATSATDPDSGPLTYQLTQAPAGASIDTNGVVTWTPTEAQGPSTNTFTVQVADTGAPPLTDSKTFSVLVNEVNSLPVLTVPATQTIAEQTALSVNATATDSDLPANTLTFALVSGPTGLIVSSAGAIAWTPTEAQGPSTNTVTVRVSDNGSPSLSATNSFQVIVSEVNSAPLLTVPGTQTIAEQTALSVNATATDSDLPANTLTFALVSGPTGLTVSSVGAIAWTPTEAQGPSTNTVTVRVFDNGSPSLSATNSFQVIVTEVNSAPLLTVPGTQTIAEQTALSANATATDSDLPANTLTFALVSGPTGLTISSAGAIAWTPTEAQGPSTNTVTVRVFDDGVPSLSATNSFQVVVTDVNSAPLLTVPGTQTIAEQTALSVNATATDSDLPANTLTFALVSGPTGLTVSSGGAIAWTPTEAQGPSTNTVTVRVFDDGSPSLSATNSFQVIVTEVNSAPLLTVPGTQTIAEQTALSVNATASDSDLPANTLTFALVSGPTGLTVSSAGAVAWTPTEAQGPSTNTVTVRVSDNGSPSLSATNSFQVIVTEVNSAPLLTVPGTQTIAEQTALSVNATATDSDLPANTLTFALVSGPTGLTVSSAGAIAWTPTEAQGPSTNTVTVRVFDDGSPSSSATNSFQVIVTEVNSAPLLTVPGTQTIAEQTALSVNATATDSDLPANTLTFALVSGPTGLTVSSAGAIAWTPTEAQGPSTNTVTVRVSDNGSPSLSATNSFQVIVTEVNSAPLLTVPGTQTIAEQTALSVNATATDSDLPSNTLTFALVSGPTGLTVSSAGAIAWTPTEAQGPSTNTVTVRVSDNGSPSLSATNSFQVIVTEVNSAPLLTVPGTQTLAELTALSVSATATDSDLPANTLTFALVSGPTGLTISSAGAIAWTPTEAQGPSTNTVTVRVSDNGSPSLSATNSFQVIVTDVNSAPLLTVPGTQTIAEQTALGVNATATDSDLPSNTLTFALVSGPTGLTVSSAGAIAWTPTEAQGPSTNTVTVRVSDNGSPSLSATNSFQVIVTEVNSAPLLTVPGTQTLAELTALSVNATATDSDLPANTLTFALVSGPTGLTVSSAGAIAWTPTEAQGPSTNTVTVRVSDNGSPSLSATNSFQVMVTEVNSAPVLTPVPDRTNLVGATVNFAVSATDSDLPTNTLVFSLATGAPAGASINPNTGVFNWTVPGPSASTNTFTVIVADNGTPSMSSTQTFRIFGVTSVPPTTQGIQIVNGNIEVIFGGTAGQTYTIEATENLNPVITWVPVATNLVPDANGLFKFVDTQARNLPMRFFRARTP